MDDSFVGTRQGRHSNSNGDRWNFVHDINGTREQLAIDHVYRNDRNPSSNTHSRTAEWEYKVRAAALSGGVFIAGVIFSVIEIVGR